ncbi:MAG: hypothetical protein E7361_03815 [Clostridiales bacterium]|nr:hypothetical protein [Clostridiales bacterium]
MGEIFIYNSQSGKGLSDKKLKKITSLLLEKYPNITICPTSRLGDAKLTTRKYIDTTNLIIVLGGDGTINDVVSAVADSPYSPIIAIIPNGTMNDLAHSLHIPKNYKKAIEIITQNNITKRDIIKVNDRYAVYGLALGRFSRTSYLTKQSWKKIFGKFAYFINATRDIYQYPTLPIDLKINGKKIIGKFSLILITTSNYIAGFKINKDNSRHRIILIEENRKKEYCSFSNMLKTMRLFAFGVKNNIFYDNNNNNIDNIIIINDNYVPIVLDGEEYIENKYDIQLIQKRINIICNNKKS